jgi:DNA-binding response OmpR family regulator
MSRPLVLVADDDPLLRQLLELRLRVAGYEVIAVRDGVAALEALQLARPFALVLDAMMPRLGGFELLRHVRAKESAERVRVIMLTALRHEDDIVSALQQGADDYLTKPFSPDELIARLGRFSRGKAA